MTPQASSPEVVSRDDWVAAIAMHRQEEKALTAQLDQLAAERRQLPRERVEKTYQFQAPSGSVTLEDLFNGRRQLIVYHHMLKPADPDPCAGCCMFGDQIPNLAHLYARDTSLVFVARAPIDEITALKSRLGWTFPFVSTDEEFNTDFGITSGFGVTVFLHTGDDIHRTYSTNGRGVETLGTPWTLLDLTPFGRQESWESSPAETPQSAPYQWWRLNDEYASDNQISGEIQWPNR